MIYRDELEKWASTGDVEVLLTVDALAAGSPDASASKASAWKGHVGVVTELIARVSLGQTGALAMMCGPEVMFRFCIRALIERGVAPDDLFVSMERNMKCATGHCGHCQWGAEFVCKDGPVFCYERIAPLFNIQEV
jgi:NAD(P)H-flavin reductase